MKNVGIFVFCLIVADNIYGQASNLPTIFIHTSFSIKIPQNIPKEANFYFSGSRIVTQRTGRDSIMVKPFKIGVQRIIAVVGSKIVWTEYYQVVGKTSKQVLFKGFENDVIVPVKIPDGSHLMLESNNGNIVPYTKDLFVILPSEAGKCKITAKLQGQKVWEDEFEVRNKDTPRLFLANVQGKPVNTSAPLPAQFSYRVMVEDDTIFQENIPNYGYRVNHISYELHRNNKPIKKIDDYSGNIQSPQTIGARLGDKVVVKVEDCQIICPRCCNGYIKILPNEFSFVVK
jgi:hypothetical protein